MKLVCLDLEGVLTPEIWITFSKKTGIKELSLTTRDISDYDVLMKKRLNILKEHKLSLSDIQDVISCIGPLSGAFEFLNELRSLYQVIILSDTFEEFAKPLMEKLNKPTIFCNSLVVDQNNMIVDYSLRQKDGKKKAVIAFQSAGYNVTAAGDSYNDISMLKTAEHGALFCPPENIHEEFPEFPVARDYSALMEIIKKTDL